MMARSNELWALMKLAEGLYLEWYACKDEGKRIAIEAEYLEVVKRKDALEEKEKADG